MIVEYEDLRSCPECGAYVADQIRHKLWHAEHDEIVEHTLKVLAGLVELTDGLVP